VVEVALPHLRLAGPLDRLADTREMRVEDLVDVVQGDGVVDRSEPLVLLSFEFFAPLAHFA
jgi:hypothetical protein